MAKTKINAKINRELKNKTVLITGGAGSIGSELAKKILEFPVDSSTRQINQRFKTKITSWRYSKC